MPHQGSRRAPYQVTKRSRACVPCHMRKVRCDASQTGVPCTRCRAAQRASSCDLLRPFRYFHGETGTQNPHVGSPVADAVPILPNGQLSGERQRTGCSSANTQAGQGPQGVETQQARQADGASFDGMSYANVGPLMQFHTGQSPTYKPMNQLMSETRSDGSNERLVQEDDMPIEMCREMGAHSSVVSPQSNTGAIKQGREMVEYLDGMNSLTILSKAVGNQQKRKLVRIVLRDRNPARSEQQRYKALDPVDLDYLQKKGAFSLPPAGIRDELFRLFFDCVYPYIPIFDCVDFLSSFEDGTYSPFLVQCVIASVIPYASLQLLHEAGFEDRRSAHTLVFTRARLLYDFGVENRQLPLLQGCLVLSIVQFTFAVDKDFRFWLATSMLLATNMGLHRDDMAQNLPPQTAKVVRRIWWVLYNRDTTNVLAGLDNVRRLHESAIDTTILSENDWTDEGIPDRFKHILPPILDIHKKVLVAHCKLSRIVARYLEAYRTPGRTPSPSDASNIQAALKEWHMSLPKDLMIACVDEWNIGNMWTFVMMARFYHFQCVFFRHLKGLSEGSKESKHSRELDLLRGSIYELNNIVERVMLHGLAKYSPLYLINCASTALALNIEIALDPAMDDQQKLQARKQFDTGFTYLRSLSDSWIGINWYLRLHEAIVGDTFGPSSQTQPLRNKNNAPTRDERQVMIGNPQLAHNARGMNDLAWSIDHDDDFGRQQSNGFDFDLEANGANDAFSSSVSDLDNMFLDGLYNLSAEGWLQDIFSGDFSF